MRASKRQLINNGWYFKNPNENSWIGNSTKLGYHFHHILTNRFWFCNRAELGSTNSPWPFHQLTWCLGDKLGLGDFLNAAFFLGDLFADRITPTGCWKTQLLQYILANRNLFLSLNFFMDCFTDFKKQIKTKCPSYIFLNSFQRCQLTGVMLFSAD